MSDQPVVLGEAGKRIHRYLEGLQRFGFSGAVLVANPRGVVLRNGYGPAGAGEPPWPRASYRITLEDPGIFNDRTLPGRGDYDPVAGATLLSEIVNWDRTIRYS